MTRFAVICDLTWVILRYIHADNPTAALKAARVFFPNRSLKVVYDEDCIASG